MIGLDTNILICYLAQDDPAQSAQATQVIERRLTKDRPGFISLVTMAETVWNYTELLSRATLSAVNLLQAVCGTAEQDAGTKHESRAPRSSAQLTNSPPIETAANPARKSV